MARTKLSVNINKYALLRNSRGHGLPDLLEASATCIAAGCHGITVHPRRDERHIQFSDVPLIAAFLREHHPNIEYNIECEDAEHIVDMVVELRPEQCTLVPVTPGEITSDHGWDLPNETERLKPVVARLKEAGIRVSLFADCAPDVIERFAETGADRVELYTGPFAWAWGTEAQAEQTTLLRESAEAAVAAGMGVNAGHDLDRFNLAGLVGAPVDEVSIGHAQICRALEIGTTQSVGELLTALGY